MLVALACVATSTAFAVDGAAEEDRYGSDQTQLRTLRSLYPATADEFERAEALLAHRPPSRAELEEAVKLFEKATQQVKELYLPARRVCQVLTALGDHDRAVAACDEARRRDSLGPLTMRATVAALMSGPGRPSPGDVGRAVMFAARIKRAAPDQPWGHAAECDIAAKIGDVEMLNGCMRELERVAPSHYETKRMAAIVASARAGWGVAIGWLGCIALTLGTIVHAVVRRSRVAKAAVAALAVLAVLSPARAGAEEEAPTAEPGAVEDPSAAAKVPRAGSLSKYKIDDANPEASIPTPEQRDGNPLEYGYFLMDLTDHAEAARKRGDHLASAKLYRAMAKAVPNRSTGFTKACEEYQAAGDIDSAMNLCAAALTRDGVTLADYSRYSRLALSKQGDLSPTDVSNLDMVVAHLKKDDTTRAVALDIECTLATRLADLPRLEKCVPIVLSLSPDSPKALFFQWALALQKKDYRMAEQLVAKAKAPMSTTDPEQWKRMERATLAASPIWRRALRDWRFQVVAGLMTLGLVITLVARRRAPGTMNAVS